MATTQTWEELNQMQDLFVSGMYTPSQSTQQTEWRKISGGTDGEVMMWEDDVA